MTFNKKFVAIFLVTLVMGINLFFGLPRLAKFSAVDEPYWTYDRTSQFWTAIAKQKWRSTNINDKPGVTVAILTGPGLLSINPMPYKAIRDEAKTPAQLAAIEKINFSFRLPIYLFCLLMLPIFFLLLRRLLNETIALLATIFIGLSPIILGMSLLINPDTLLWVFLPLSLLSFLIFQKEDNRKYLYLAGFLLGLSLLTKYVANILYVYFILLIFFEYIFNTEAQKTSILQYLKKALGNYTILVAISMLTFFVLFPATWKSPEMLLKGTFLSVAFQSVWPLFAAFLGLLLADAFAFRGRATTWVLAFFNRHKLLLIRAVSVIFLITIAAVLLNTYAGMRAFDFEAILSSPKGGENPAFNAQIFFGNILADTYSLIFGLTPVVFFAFLVGLLRNAWWNKNFSRENLVIFYFTLFILFYYLASTVNSVGATVRYQIVLYPLASIIAAIGCYQLSQLEKVKKYFTNSTLLFVLILLSVGSLALVKPFFFSYNSALLPEKYIINMKDMGDGSFEAAQYLNSLPGAHEFTIWSDKGAVCESFVGKCNVGLSLKDTRNKNFDYFVVSTGRKSRTLKLASGASNDINFKIAYTTEAYEKKIEIAGRPNNTVKIIPGRVLYIPSK